MAELVAIVTWLTSQGYRCIASPPREPRVAYICLKNKFPQTAYVAKLYANADRLTRVDAYVELAREPFDLDACVEQIAALARLPYAGARGDEAYSWIKNHRSTQSAGRAMQFGSLRYSFQIDNVTPGLTIEVIEPTK